MSFLGTRNAVAIGVSQHLTLGGPDLLSKLSPSLILQFAGAQTMDPRITFTRSTTATFTGSNGLLQTAAINTPRFDYDPVTLAPLGLLIEEQRTNLVTYSEQFDNAAWTKTNASVTANTIVSPDGALTADKLVENTANGFHLAQSATITPTASTLYTFTCYAKAAERTQVSVAFTGGGSADSGVIFNLLNGTYVATIGVAPNSYNIISVGDGWYRCSITWVTTNTNVIAGRVYSALSSAISYTGDGTSGIYIWGAQLEAGAFPTSYIPTVASQVTRAADVAVMAETNFSSWYTQGVGTLFTNATLNSSSVSDATVVEIGNGTNANRITVASGASTLVWNPFVINASVSQGSSNVGVSKPPKTVGQVAFAWETNSFVAAAGGTLGPVDTSGSIPTVTQLRIGANSDGGNCINSHIRKIAYYPRRLSNAALQGITS